MRAVDRVRLAVAGVGLALTAGCTSITDGTPIAGPGVGPHARPPNASPPTAVPAPPPPPTQAPDGTIPLPPNDRGYVFIETKSGKTRCQITTGDVGCEAAFTNSPIKDGERANGVNISADGTVEWILGNLGNIPVVTIDYLTYAAQGWTIAASIDGTRFTNNDSGHGMFVSIENVETF